MKKKLVALVALAAMVLSMLPVAAFGANESTDSGIHIDIFSYNNDIEQNENVLITIKGDKVVKGMRVVCYQNNVADAVYTDFINANGEDVIYLPKSKLPNLDDVSAQNTLTVNVTSANGDTVYESETFKQDYVASLPESMNVTIDNGSGNENRTLTFTFDEGYVPGDKDRIAFQNIGANGNALKTQYSDYITANNLKTNSDGTRTFTVTNEDFEKNAASVRCTFERDGEDVTALSKTVSLASKYGELDYYDFAFDTGSLVERGQDVTGKIYYVNKDGKRHDITDECFFAVTPTNLVETITDSSDCGFTVKKDAELNKVVTITALFNGNKIASQSFTIVSDADPGDVKMNRTSYNAGEETGIEFTLLDDKGQTMKLDFFPSDINIRWIDSSVSDPGFRVNLTDHGASITTKGKLLTSITCDKPCTGKFEITFTDDKGHAYQVVSDTFTFKDPDAEPEGAQKVVVTIGSTTMQVDGKNKTIIAPPIIDNGRTYVPLRAISEAFGATVDWKQASNLITIDRGDTHIVMTPYKLAYTLNGQEKMMDVAPYISTAYASTMVPVRFIADAFGFDSIPEYNADNTTRAVTFTVK